MAYKRTGRPPGRPRGSTSKHSPAKAQALASKRRIDIGMTPDQIDAAGPLDALHALLRHALRTGDVDPFWMVALDGCTYDCGSVHQETAPTEADARAKMLIYLIESKLITL